MRGESKTDHGEGAEPGRKVRAARRAASMCTSGCARRAAPGKSKCKYCIGWGSPARRAERELAAQERAQRAARRSIKRNPFVECSRCTAPALLGPDKKPLPARLCEYHAGAELDPVIAAVRAEVAAAGGDVYGL